MQLTHQRFRNERQLASSPPKSIAKLFLDVMKCLISAYTCYQPDSPSFLSPNAKTWRYGRSIHEQ